ncbi:hypothetical protein EDB87DRAFT_1656176, partial [Lactarius vividus]
NHAKTVREVTYDFTLLVIGRANAGKTTLLKRVCNTTDEPCIYDEKSNSLLEPISEVLPVFSLIKFDYLTLLLC